MYFWQGLFFLLLLPCQIRLSGLFPFRTNSEMLNLTDSQQDSLDWGSAWCKVTLGWHPLKIWVFVTNVTNKFISGLDILCAYHASVDLGHQTLRLAGEEVSLWSPEAGPWPSSPVVANDQVIPAQCKRVVMARLESLLGMENGLEELSLEAHFPERLCIARTLVWDSQEVPMGVLNATHHDQKLTKGSSLAHCEPVTLVTPPNVGQLQARDTTPK
jgi:hypothetical protein